MSTPPSWDPSHPQPSGDPSTGGQQQGGVPAPYQGASPLGYDPSAGQPTSAQQPGQYAAPQYEAPQYGGQQYGAPQAGGEYGAPQAGGQYGAAQPGGQYGAPQAGGQYGGPQPGGDYSVPPTGGVPAYAAAPAPPPGQPGAPVKKTPGWVRPVIGVVVLGLIALGVWLLNRNNVENAKVGDCVIVKTDKDFTKTDCSSPEAEYKVISIDETDIPTLACNGADVDASIYTEGKDAKSWCLQGVWKEGDCLKSDGSDRIDCATASATDLKVLKVLEGTQDEQGCPQQATTYRTYQDSNKVLCLAEAA